MKRILYLSALLVGLSANACAQPPVSVKIMSYNIRNGNGIDGTQDLERVAGLIVRVAPDVVALQETDSVTTRMNKRNIPSELEHMTGMHATFCRAIDFQGGGYGIGLLSRAKPLHSRRIPLPGREEARVLLIAEFTDYFVCATHLSLTPEDQSASLEIIRTATDTCRKPVLLAGDFNIKRPHKVTKGLGEAFRPISDTTQATFPALAPKVCIDYLFGRGLPDDALVEKYRVDHTAAGSDHCPLWATVVWKP